MSDHQDCRFAVATYLRNLARTYADREAVTIPELLIHAGDLEDAARVDAHEDVVYGR